MPLSRAAWRSLSRALTLGTVLGGVVLVGHLVARAQGDSHISASRHVGAAACARCHSKAALVWQHSAHARALSSLDARNQGDPKCRQCHTMVPEGVDPTLDGVQCEACHGGGRYYALDYVMRDRELREALGFEVAGPETCQRCHTANAPSVTPFEYSRALERIRHDEN